MLIWMDQKFCSADLMRTNFPARMTVNQWIRFCPNHQGTICHEKICWYGGSLPTRCDISSCIPNFETQTEGILGKEDYRKKNDDDNNNNNHNNNNNSWFKQMEQFFQQILRPKQVNQFLSRNQFNWHSTNELPKVTSHLKINLWCHHQPHAPSWNVGNLELQYLMGWTDLNIKKSLGSSQRLLSFPPGPIISLQNANQAHIFSGQFKQLHGQAGKPTCLQSLHIATKPLGTSDRCFSYHLRHHPTKQQQLQNTPRPQTSQYRSIQSQQVLNLLSSCHHVK